jgi:hypothetical protein
MRPKFEKALRTLIAGAIGSVLIAGAGFPAFAVTWNIFGDVDAIKSANGSPTVAPVGKTSPPSTKLGSFSLGELSLHMSGNISDRMTVLVEAAVQTNADESQSIETERYQITYLFSDLFKLTAGRFHEAMGYYNTAFHHGRILQTTIDRPLFLRFEDSGGAIPTHLVGLWGYGNYEMVPGTLQYDLMVGNGPKVTGIGSDNAQLDVAKYQDNNTSKSVTARLTYLPTAVPNLGLGVYGLTSQTLGYNDPSIPNPGLETMSVDQIIYGADLFYNGKALEIISELYQFNDKNRLAIGPNSGEMFYASAYFIQLGYTIPHSAFKPYLRYEGLDHNDTDPYFNAIGFGSYRRMVYGVRYNLDVHSALKLEGRSNHIVGQREYQEVAAQWAFTF